MLKASTTLEGTADECSDVMRPGVDTVISIHVAFLYELGRLSPVLESPDCSLGTRVVPQGSCHHLAIFADVRFTATIVSNSAAPRRENSLRRVRFVFLAQRGDDIVVLRLTNNVNQAAGLGTKHVAPHVFMSSFTFRLRSRTT